MLKNYLKIALRNLRRNKLYSFINIAGLAVGVAVFMLLAMYVHYEFSFDRYNKKANRIYRLTSHHSTGLFTPGPLAPALVSESPAVKSAFRLRGYGRALVAKKNKQSFEKDVYAADPSIFSVLTLPMVQGNPKTALDDPNGVVINESMARKYFGNEDPLGKMLEINKSNKRVTGVIQNMPSNAHFHIRLLEPITNENGVLLNNWNGAAYYTYILLKKGHRPAEAIRAIQRLIDSNQTANASKHGSYGLQPLTKIHLYSRQYSDYKISQSNGDIRYVMLYSAIALMILIIACINYINLATARSIRRIREVALRKVVGASRHQLIIQFLGESLLLSFLAVSFGLILAKLILPIFGTLIHRHLTLSNISPLLLIGFLLLLILFIGLGAGGYLALYLSRYHPTRLFQRGNHGAMKGFDLRRVLIVFQFFVSAMLILATIIIYQQLVYVRNAPLGFNKRNLVSIVPEGAWDKRNVLKQKIAELSGVTGITSGAASGTRMITKVQPKHIKGYGNGIMTHISYVDTNFVRIMGIQTVRGRNFSSRMPTDSIKSALINQAATQAYGWKNPVGKKLSLRGKQYKVIGVIKNYHFLSLKSKIGPLIFLFKPSELKYDNILARIKGDNIHQTLQQMESVWKSIAPGWPFQYHFVNQQFKRMYSKEQHLADLIEYFTIIAIILACLGLFGLAAFSAEQRTKEIGIRKVLGASVAGIVGLLSKDFLKLVAIGFVIAVPISWYGMHRWLQNFAYKIHMSPWIFLLAGGLALVIALATVSWQAVRAALMNPVDALRSE